MISHKVSPEIIESSTERPWLVTTLSLAVFLFGVFHLFKFIQVLNNIKILKSLPMTISPIYLAIDGFLWGILGIYLFWCLWNGRTWAGKLGQGLILIYALFFWIEQLWISEPEILQTRWLFNLILTIIGLSGIVLILNIKSSRAFFEKTPAKIN